MTLFSVDDEPAGPPASRRGRAGVIFVIVAFVCGLALAFTPSPYVIAEPGPVFNTIGSSSPVGSDARDAPALLSVEGHETYPTSGSLDLLTASLLGTPTHPPSWMDVAGAWLDPTRAALPLDAVFPPTLTVDQVQKLSFERMDTSQQDAVAAALLHLGYTVGQTVTVAQVFDDSPAHGVLAEGDRIVAIDGAEVEGVETLHEELDRHGTSHPVTVVVQRGGSEKTLRLTPQRKDGRVLLGVGVTTDFDFPFTVKVHLDDVGGPSAGMMLALGVIDVLTPGSLTGGEHFAGTGTITPDGRVGVIGDIRQKMHGARDAGARWFLAPKGNCDEVVGHVPDGLHVYAVSTLSQALDVVTTVAGHESRAALPRCR